MDFFEVLKNKASGTSEQDKTLSGVPPIIIPDSNGKPLSEWSITGNTYQAWTPSPEPQIGNNKLDNSKIEKSSTITNFVYTDSSVSFGSMTVGSTINSAEIKAEDTSYAFSFSGDTSKVSFALKCYDSSHTYLGDANKLFDEENRAVMTLLSNTVYVRLVITTTVQGNVSLTNLMLNKGNTVMAFETFKYLPNTGPCEVKGTGDKAENLFTDKTVYHNTIGEDAFWYASATSSSVIIEVQPNTKYYIKTETILPIFRIGLSRNRPDVLSKFYETYRLTNTNTLEITTGENINYLVFQGSQSLEITWLNELYVGQGYKIDVVSRGKNLLPLNTISNIGWAKTYPNLVPVFNSLTKGTYCISFDITLNEITKPEKFSSSFARIIVTNPSDNLIRLAYWAGKQIGDTITLDANFTITDANIGKFTNVYFYGCGNDQNAACGICDIKNIQLELGDTSTEYEPYIEPKTSEIYLDSPLMANETLDSTGKREKEWGVKVFDGSERIARDASKNAYRYAFTDLNDAGVPKTFLYCSHFKNAEPALEGFDGTITTTPTSTAFRCWIWSNNFDSLDSFKAFLKSEYDAGHPVTVWYQLAEPTSETVDVPQVPTIKGTTVIDVDTEVKATNMAVTYKSGTKNKVKTFDNNFYRLLFSNN